MVDYGCLGGPFWNRSWGYFSFGSGISWQRFEERTGAPRDNPGCDGWLCADSLYDTRVKWVPGLPLEALAVFKLWFIGAGIRLYLNTNPHNSYVGSGLVLFLGGGATRRRDPRDEEIR